jgi:hypothetical protein
MATLPTLPKALNGKRAALTTTEFTQKLRGGIRNVDPTDVADISDRHQQYLDSNARDIASLISWVQDFVTAVAARGALYTQEQTLVDPTTNITATVAPVAGSILKVVLIQDATGGRQITWGSEFVWASVDIGTTALSTSIFTFLGRTVSGVTSWYLSELPLVEQL